MKGKTAKGKGMLCELTAVTSKKKIENMLEKRTPENQ